MKKPLNENQVKTIRKMTADNSLHNLLINLSTDLMLRASDLLKLKVSDVMFENGNVIFVHFLRHCMIVAFHLPGIGVFRLSLDFIE